VADSQSRASLTEVEKQEGPEMLVIAANLEGGEEIIGSEHEIHVQKSNSGISIPSI
jgi:hypothetical protein